MLLPGSRTTPSCAGGCTTAGSRRRRSTPSRCTTRPSNVRSAKQQTCDSLERVAPLTQRVARKARNAIISVGYFRGPLLMSALRKRWVKFRNPTATIEFGKHTYCGPGFSLHMPFGGTFITGSRVEFRRKFRAEVGPEGRIEIGSGSYLTYDVIISCDTTISIGERCGLGQSTYVADGSHKYRDLDETFLRQGYDY